MTQFLCPIHGMQAALFTSSKIQRRIVRGNKIQRCELVHLELTKLSEVPAVYKVDREFIEENRETIKQSTEESEFELECKLVPVCKKCFYEHLID